MDNDISELNGEYLVKSSINDMNVIEHMLAFWSFSS